jgi:hypothetical protein
LTVAETRTAEERDAECVLAAAAWSESAGWLGRGAADGSVSDANTAGATAGAVLVRWCPAKTSGEASASSSSAAVSRPQRARRASREGTEKWSSQQGEERVEAAVVRAARWRPETAR